MSVNIKSVLDHKDSHWDLGECTIREYLVELSRRCWREEDSFSGKRPFGNSGWKWDVCFALARGGFIGCERDEDGDFVDVDEKAAEKIIEEAFQALKESK